MSIQRRRRWIKRMGLGILLSLLCSSTLWAITYFMKGEHGSAVDTAGARPLFAVMILIVNFSIIITSPWVYKNKIKHHK